MFRLGKLVKLRLLQIEKCLSYFNKPVSLKCLRVVCLVVVTNTGYCQKPEEEPDIKHEDYF